MYIGIDVGGTTVKALLLKGNEIVTFDKVPNDTTSKETVLKSIRKGIEKIVTPQELEKVQAIGLSIAGQVDHKNGILKNAPNMPLKNFDFYKFFRDEFGKSSYVDNDVNCAAIAESSLYPPHTTQLFIFLGTGIGGAAIIDGRLLRGSDNLGMEIGHMTFKDGGHSCGCGQKGCYEAYAGGKSLIRLYKEATGKDGVAAVEIERQYLAGDEIATPIFKNALMALSELTNDLVTLLNPEYIIFGGGVIDHSKVILPEIKKYLSSKIRFADFKKLKFKESVFKDQSNAYGAIIGFIEHQN